MSNEACPLPPRPTAAQQSDIEALLRGRRIAVVGISDDPSRPSHYVSKYLQEAGYEIVPVNPSLQQVLGRAAVGKLAEVKPPPDVVLVFRRSDACAEVARQAVDAGAKGIWLQSGIHNDEARRLAADAGIPFVEDRCMMVEHRRRH